MNRYILHRVIQISTYHLNNFKISWSAFFKLYFPSRKKYLRRTGYAISITLFFSIYIFNTFKLEMRVNYSFIPGLLTLEILYRVTLILTHRREIPFGVLKFESPCIISMFSANDYPLLQVSSLLTEQNITKVTYLNNDGFKYTKIHLAAPRLKVSWTQGSTS